MPLKGKLRHDLRSIAAKVSALSRNVPRIVGNEAVKFSKDCFREQGFIKDGGHVNKWKKRGVEQKGKHVLVDSGALRRSVRVLYSNSQVVGIGSDLKYAQIHNEGGTVRVTAKMRKYFWHRYYKSGKLEAFWKNMALNKSGRIRIPRRQFIGPSGELDRRIERKIKLEMLRALK